MLNTDKKQFVEIWQWIRKTVGRTDVQVSLSASVSLRPLPFSMPDTREYVHRGGPSFDAYNYIPRLGFADLGVIILQLFWRVNK